MDSGDTSESRLRKEDGEFTLGCAELGVPERTQQEESGGSRVASLERR